MENRPYVFYNDFKRLNEVAPPDELDDTELVEATNLVYKGNKVVAKRTGMERYNEDPYHTNPITRVISYEKKSLLLVADGTTLRKGNGDVIKDNFNNTNFDWVVYSDGKLYLVNGHDYYSYDGTTLISVVPADGSLDHIKRCKYIVQRGERLFFSGDPENPNAIYYSNLGSPDNCPTLNMINAVSDDNDVITGLSEFHQAMVAFKRRHVYAWFGWDPAGDVRFDKINVHTGTLHNRTIQRVRNLLFYLGEDGVYALQGLESDYISSLNMSDDVIRNRFKDSITDSSAVFYDGKYMVAVGSNVLVYDFPNQAWSVWTWAVKDFEIYDNDLFFGSPTTSMVYKLTDEYNDDGASIPFKMTTRSFNCKYPLHYKKFSWFYLLMGEGEEANEVNVTVLCDHQPVQLVNGIQLNTVRVPGADMLDATVPEHRTRLFYKKANLLARSLRAQVTIENDEVDEGVTIYGMGFQFWPIRV